MGNHWRVILHLSSKFWTIGGGVRRYVEFSRWRP